MSRLLLDLRERNSIKQAEAARSVGITQSKLSRAETGRGTLPVDIARRLADLYNASRAERARLTALSATSAPERLNSRLIMQRGKNLKLQERIGQLEEGSSLVRAYSPSMIVGALQTPEYALTVFEATSRQPSFRAVSDPPAQLAAARARRWERLQNDHSRRWILIMAEGALNWMAGGPELMTAQMDRLIEASQLPHLDLGIIPLRAPAAVFIQHGFDLYDSRAVCVGTKTATGIESDEAALRDYEFVFTALEGMASFGFAAEEIIAQTKAAYSR